MPLTCIAKYQVITMHSFKCMVPLRKKIKEISTEFKKVKHVIVQCICLRDMIEPNLKISIKCPVKYFDIFVSKLIN